MNRGAKRLPPRLKVLTGSYRRDRDAHAVELGVTEGTPTPPAWLPPDAVAVWNETWPRVAGLKLVGKQDAGVFANYCALTAALARAWRGNTAPPPAALLSEHRKVSELLGLAGAKSRVGRGLPEP